MGPTHVCLFDIDGTLILSGGAGKAALEAALASEFGVARISDALDLRGRTDRAILAELVGCHGLDPCPDTCERLLAAYLRQLPGQMRKCPGRVLPGIAELLRTLVGRPDVALGLLTGNIREGARPARGSEGEQALIEEMRVRKTLESPFDPRYLLEVVRAPEEGSRHALVEAGVPFELLSPAGVRERFPVTIPDDAEAVFQADAGIVRADLAHAALVESARRAGARVQEETRVESLEDVDAGAVVVTAGAWARLTSRPP